MAIRNSIAVLVTMCVVLGCAVPRGNSHRQPSPNTTGNSPSRISPPSPRFVVGPEDTNDYFSITLSWGEADQIDHFNLYFGSAPGTYTNTINVGTDTNYTLSYTNWSESGVRHYFVVTAVDSNGSESLPSNEAHFPFYPPDHFRLDWISSDSTMISTSQSVLIPRSQWPVFAVVIGTNSFSTNLDTGAHFFIIDHAEPLTITAYNPNP